MKVKILLFLTVLFFMTLLNAASEDGTERKNPTGTSKYSEHKISQDTIHFINKTMAKDFVFVMRDKSVNPDTIYKNENGELFFNTNQVGYFRTKNKFDNYKLHCEWKWLEKATNSNSGVLIYTQEPDSVWPKCIQVQLKQKRAGDLIAMNGGMIAEAAGKPKDTAERLADSNEKENGKWNYFDVICTPDSLIVYVNGALQNKGTKVNLTEGTIGFQLEGKPVYFRNIYIIK
ncbi:MAG: DUF1080 domain-containing protein [Ignavibacteriales bacterium]|nr:DUF1080 domain-containing protein [Ignavibacteriales bacterium]